MLLRGIVLLVSAAALAAAAPPAMTVTAAGGFTVNETGVPASAAAAIPVSPGDEITTGDAGAVLRVGNEAVLVLAPHSSVRTAQKDDGVLLDLTGGSLEYKLTPEAKVQLANRGKAVARAAQGKLSAARGKTLPIVLASGAGAGVVAATVALVRRSQTCPDGTPADHDCGTASK